MNNKYNNTIYPKYHRKSSILNIEVDFNLNYEDVIKIINNFTNSDNTHIVVTINPEFIIDAQKDKEFQNILNKADLSVPDGTGVIIAKKFLNKVYTLNNSNFKFIKALILGTIIGVTYPFKKDKNQMPITGSDLIIKLCENAEKKCKTVFLLGGRPRRMLRKFRKDAKISKEISISKEAQKILQNKFKKLNILGATSEFNRDESDDEKTIEYIHECMQEKNVKSVDYIIVGYGHNHQEKWLSRNIDKIPAKVGIGVGAGLDYIANIQVRAPEVFIKFNLEWLYRLITQPWRIKRICKAFPVFPIKVFLSAIQDNN